MIHSVGRVFQIVAIFGCLSSSIYYILCLWAAGIFLRVRQTDGSRRPPQALPPVSILKPLRGTDPDIYESFRSHCLQEYPDYEIIFGVSDPDDPAIELVERLQAEFPARNIRLMVCPKVLGTNLKVSNLVQMLPLASYE